MPLVSSLALLQKAQAHSYAVPAFNIENMEMAQAVVAAAENQNSPVLIQTTPGTVEYAGLPLLSAIVQAVAKNSTVPVALHLDHGNTFELCENAIYNGYTSIMIDGSKLPFEENLALTKKTVERAKLANVPVEGELGSVGGKEDLHEVKEKDAMYTDPAQAKEFAIATKVDSLAIAIGTAHGFYKGTPKLDFQRLDAIRKAVSVPLVLHGASGVPDEDVQQCIALGCCKVNFATELRVAFTKGVRHVLENDSVYDPKQYAKMGGKEVYDLVLHKIAVCKSAGMAQ